MPRCRRAAWDTSAGGVTGVVASWIAGTKVIGSATETGAGVSGAGVDGRVSVADGADPTGWADAGVEGTATVGTGASGVAAAEARAGADGWTGGAGSGVGADGAGAPEEAGRVAQTSWAGVSPSRDVSTQTAGLAAGSAGTEPDATGTGGVARVAVGTTVGAGAGAAGTAAVANSSRRLATAWRTELPPTCSAQAKRSVSAAG